MCHECKKKRTNIDLLEEFPEVRETFKIPFPF